MALVLRSEWVQQGQPPESRETVVTTEEIKNAPAGKKWSAPRPPHEVEEASYAEAILIHRDDKHACVEILAWVKKGGRFAIEEKRTLFIPLVDLF